jgi:thiol:disulfide interchange protein DsbA
MKKISLIFVTLLFSSLAFAAPQFVEGKHYEVVGKQKSSRPIVTEMFSFYCPACYGFEPIAKGIEKSLPQGVKFNKNHVNTMRQATPATQDMLTRALVVGKKLKLGHKMIDAIFNHIHKDRKSFGDQDDVKALFVANGISGDRFDNAMKSFTVKAMAKKMKKYQDDLIRRKAYSGIPAVIVNEKYKVVRKELRNQEDYNNLVKFLLAQK